VSQPLSRAIRLFVADSSPISSQLLAEALARDSGIDLVGFSSDPTEVVRCIRVSHVDVVLVSARMEEEPTRGVVLLQQLRAESPGVKAVMLLDSSKSAAVVQAFRSGASGVFCRSTAIPLLCKCIAAVHKGQIWANSEELGFVLAALAANVPSQLDGKRLIPLSSREKQVVHCLVEGLTNREIAQMLAISQHTVKNYVYKIFEKLGVSNRVELVFQVLSKPDYVSAVQATALQEPMTPLPPEPVHSDLRPFPNLREPKQVAILRTGSASAAARIVPKAMSSF
jgi:DNA-binding NarL/FixJ family response regulator